MAEQGADRSRPGGGGGKKEERNLNSHQIIIHCHTYRTYSYCPLFLVNFLSGALPGTFLDYFPMEFKLSTTWILTRQIIETKGYVFQLLCYTMERDMSETSNPIIPAPLYSRYLVGLLQRLISLDRYRTQLFWV